MDVTIESSHCVRVGSAKRRKADSTQPGDQRYLGSTQQGKPVRAVQREHDEGYLGDDSDNGARLVDHPTSRSSRASVDMVDLTSDIDDEATTPQATVIEPTIALRPACLKYHHGFKGKGPDRDRGYLRPQFRACGEYEICDGARLCPRSASTSVYRLQTSHPSDDLKRWLLTRNNCIGGGGGNRDDSGFLLDARFTSALLRATLALAVEEIHYEHEHMKHLARYGRRSPYRLHLPLPLAPEAEARYFGVDPSRGEENFVGFSRKGLVVELVQAADELDYLRAVSEEMAAKVLREKMEVAVDGDWGEQGELVGAGFVSEEWVREFC